jgi:hypothetical protein
MKEPRTPHHIVAESVGPTKTTIESYSVGQVFIRHGAPCMRVSSPEPPVCTTELMWVVNLLTGSLWAAGPDEFVEPAYRVKLRYERTEQ